MTGTPVIGSWLAMCMHVMCMPAACKRLRSHWEKQKKPVYSRCKEGLAGDSGDHVCVCMTVAKRSVFVAVLQFAITYMLLAQPMTPVLDAMPLRLFVDSIPWEDGEADDVDMVIKVFADNRIKDSIELSQQ